MHKDIAVPKRQMWIRVARQASFHSAAHAGKFRIAGAVARGSKDGRQGAQCPSTSALRVTALRSQEWSAVMALPTRGKTETCALPGGDWWLTQAPATRLSLKNTASFFLQDVDGAVWSLPWRSTSWTAVSLSKTQTSSGVRPPRPARQCGRA